MAHRRCPLSRAPRLPLAGAAGWTALCGAPADPGSARHGCMATNCSSAAGLRLSSRGDGDLATRTMLDNTVLFGLEQLTGGLPAFVNCTTESLTEHLVDVLPPSMTVLEILETLEPTPAPDRCLPQAEGLRLPAGAGRFRVEAGVRAAGRTGRLHQSGFCAHRRRASASACSSSCSGVTVALVAEKIETQEEYEQACEEGFTLFQGYYFCRPVLMKTARFPPTGCLTLKSCN